MAKAKVQTMQAIISTSINFRSAEDVKAYQGLDWMSLPEDDMEYNEVTRYIVGYKNIILLGLNGRRLYTGLRRNIKGLAIDGQPIVIHGKDFKRIGIDDEATAVAAGEDGLSEEAVDAAVAEAVAAELAADGAKSCGTGSTTKRAGAGCMVRPR